MNARALVAVALVALTSCAPTLTPRPAPVLEFQRLSPFMARATLTPAPSAPARWTVQPSEECGADNGPVIVAGVWPAQASSVVIPASLADLVRVTFSDGSAVADCP